MNLVLTILITLLSVASASLAQTPGQNGCVTNGGQCLTQGGGVLKGDSNGGFTNATPDIDYVPSISSNGVDIIDALSSVPGGEVIGGLSTDAQNNVHIAYGGANALVIDSPASVSQGGFQSPAYLDSPTINNSFTGGTDSCTNSMHVYKLSANAVITLNCLGTPAQHLIYYFYQPTTGSTTYNYSFVAGGGADLLPPTLPPRCAVVNCIDKVTIDWVASQNDYIENLEITNVGGGTGGGGGGGGSSCPTGQTCYYVSSSIGSDSNDGLGPDATGAHHPWATIDKGNNALHLLNPGDQILFKAGDTWDGTQLLNHPFYLRGSANMALSPTTISKITPSTAVVIGAYGSGPDPSFDMANNWGFCFMDMDPSTNSVATGSANLPVQDIIIQHFECEHAATAGVQFLINNGTTGEPGMVVRNMYIHHTGYGCASITNDATGCLPVGSNANGNTIPPPWASLTNYTAGSPTNDAWVLAEGSGSTHQWWKETASSCKSGGSTPSWPQCDVSGTCTAGVTSLTEGSPACTWVYMSRGYSYENQLNFDDTTSNRANVGRSGFRMENNVVSNGGGHNLTEIEGDAGNGDEIGNTIGPGGPHGQMDVKRVGNYAASTPTQILVSLNHVSCGYSLPPGADGGSQGLCIVNDPAFFAEGLNSPTGVVSGASNVLANIRWQLNTVFDSVVGFQVSPTSQLDDCATACGNNTLGCGANNSVYCPVHAQIYNNTVFAPLGKPAGTYGIYAASQNGAYAGSIMDVRNNIFDGARTVLNIATGRSGLNWQSITEDYNDLGGTQGYTTYTVSGHSAGSHSLNCSSAGVSTCDPKYACEKDSSCSNVIDWQTPAIPNFSLQSSPFPSNGGNGVPVLVSGYKSMGAYP